MLLLSYPRNRHRFDNRVITVLTPDEVYITPELSSCLYRSRQLLLGPRPRSPCRRVVGVVILYKTCGVELTRVSLGLKQEKICVRLACQHHLGPRPRSPTLWRIVPQINCLFFFSSEGYRTDIVARRLSSATELTVQPTSQRRGREIGL